MKINEINFDPTKKSIVIIEGAQGVGKTTFCNYCRETIPFSNMYRLSGTSDKTQAGLAKSIKMYDALQDYLDSISTCDLNLIFDRTFFSEEVYCRLGYKEYSFSQAYKGYVERLNKLDMNIFVVILYVENAELYTERLKREKTRTFTNFLLETSIEQQNMYLQLANELQEYSNIHPILVATDDFEQAYAKLHNLIPAFKTKLDKV